MAEHPPEQEAALGKAMTRLKASRRLLAHSRACPAMHEGSCACGAQEAADDLVVVARAYLALLAAYEDRSKAFESLLRVRDILVERAIHEDDCPFVMGDENGDGHVGCECYLDAVFGAIGYPDLDSLTERITHGRHCTCSACAREDWTKITAPCGMHGEGCPAEYQPLGSPEFTSDFRKTATPPPLSGKQHPPAAVMERLLEEVARQDRVHPEGFQATRNGVRLGIATAQDELNEALGAWDHAKRLPLTVDRWQAVQDELVQVAAVALRTLRSMPPTQELTSRVGDGPWNTWR